MHIILQEYSGLPNLSSLKGLRWGSRSCRIRTYLADNRIRPSINRHEKINVFSNFPALKTENLSRKKVSQKELKLQTCKAFDSDFAVC